MRKMVLLVVLASIITDQRSIEVIYNAQVALVRRLRRTITTVLKPISFFSQGYISHHFSLYLQFYLYGPQLHTSDNLSKLVFQPESSNSSQITSLEKLIAGCVFPIPDPKDSR